MNIRKRFTTVLSSSLLVLASIVTLPGAAGRAVRASEGPNESSVQFTDCVESIGVGLVPTSNARALVPTSFVLAGDGQPVTPFVVRTARCDEILVNGHGGTSGEIVQVGAIIVPPDGTGDINNYSLWYYTSDLRLALNLLLAGVNAQWVPTIAYALDQQAGSLSVRVPLPGIPRFRLSGTVAPSAAAAGSFTANWWQATHGGAVKMETKVPIIKIGNADLTLSTNPHSALAQLIGDETTGFPIIQQFNTFSAATLTVQP